jgi:hypothetical protein
MFGHHMLCMLEHLPVLAVRLAPGCSTSQNTGVVVFIGSINGCKFTLSKKGRQSKSKSGAIRKDLLYSQAIRTFWMRKK